jgi:hypothetical protein
MGDIEIAYDLHAETAREQQSSDPILSQLALATIMLSLEVELLAFVRALNAADANRAPIEQSSHRPFARLVRGFATMNIRFPRRSTHHQLQHSPA